MAWKNLKHIPADDKKLKYGSVEVYSPVFLKDYTDLRIQNTLPKNPHKFLEKIIYILRTKHCSVDEALLLHTN